MNRTEVNYSDEAASDAKSTVENFADEILEMLTDSGKASDDLNNDYPNGDAYHHESHVDKWYDLQEACAILTQLDDFEETDSGLWEGLGMKEALSACAAYTYGSAVYSAWSELITKINDEADNIISDFDTEAEDLESEIDDCNTEADEADTDAELEDDDILSNQHREKAGDYRRQADEKQALLDSLDDRKSDALKAMIDEFTK